MNRILSTVAAILTAMHLGAAPNADFPKVDDTSGREPNGDQVIRLAVNVPAATNEVWATLTTSEGWKSFAAAFAAVDFQVGGFIETSYKADAKQGDPANIKNQIVAYIPRRMLAIRCVQTPPGFKHKEEFLSTATVLEIAPADGGGSRVTITAMGYRRGEAYDELFKHFRWGDAYTLNKLLERFEQARPAVPKDSPVESKDKQ